MQDSAQPQTGTTIVACAYEGGVVLAADGRVSVGSYISNRASNKLAPLSDNVFILRSGSASDTQAIADYGAAVSEAAGQPRRGPAAACDRPRRPRRRTTRARSSILRRESAIGAGAGAVRAYCGQPRPHGAASSPARRLARVRAHALAPSNPPDRERARCNRRKRGASGVCLPI